MEWNAFWGVTLYMNNLCNVVKYLYMYMYMYAVAILEKNCGWAERLGGMLPQENFYIRDLLRSILKQAHH